MPALRRKVCVCICALLACLSAVWLLLLHSHLSSQTHHQWAFGEVTSEEVQRARAQIERIERTMNRSRLRLDDLRIAEDENSEELPRLSHFGTVGALESVCQRQGNDSARCVRPFRNLEARYRFAPKYRTVACLIQKSMSTLLQAVMCLLFDERQFVAAGRTLGREFGKVRLCKGQNELNQLPRVRAALRERFALQLDQFSFVAIVRDPVQRFLSGFVDKCVRQPHSANFCHGCRANLSCFVQREYAHMMREAGHVRMGKSFEDMHFFPQNWRCNFHQMLANFTLLRVTSASNLSALLLDFLRPRGLSEPIAQLIRAQMDTKEQHTLHSTSGTKVHAFFERRLRSSAFLMEFVVRMFFHDFRIFNFSLPQMAF